MSLKDLSGISLKECFNFLLLQMKENALQINKNNKIIKNVSKSEKDEDYILNTINKLHHQNVFLMKENNRFMELYGTVVRFLSDYQIDLQQFLSNHTTNISQCNISEILELKEIIMEKTLNDEFPFNELHPFYNDDHFIKQLVGIHKNADCY
ncbi:MAG: hypothetical protein ACLFVR_13665 [Thiohalospira sp.]